MDSAEHEKQAARLARWEGLNASRKQLERMIENGERDAKPGVYVAGVKIKDDTWGSSHLDPALIDLLRRECKRVVAEMADV